LGYSGNIPKYYLYKALRFPLLWMPIYVVFFQDARGLSLAHIGIIDAVFWLATALGEVPTGVIADRYGRKTSMLLGTALYTVSISLVAFVESFPVIILAYVGWGIALTLTSGADEALLYESLKADNRTHEYTSVYSRVEVIQVSARAIGSVVGGFLAGVMLALPFWISALLGLLTFVVVLTMKEPPQELETTSQRYTDIMLASLHLIRTRPIMRWALFYLAVIPLGPFIISFVYIQPYALQVGLQIESLGILVMLINLAAMIGVLLAPRLIRLAGEVRTLVVIPPILLMGLITLSLITAWHGLIVMAGLSLFMAVIRPVVMTIIHRELNDNVRATIVSLGSLAFTLLLAIFSPIYGWLADTRGLSAVFAVMAISLAIAMFLASQMRRPRFLARRISSS